MTADIYILGTSHSIQCGSSECDDYKILEFDREIRRICSDFSIKRIAEEISLDGMDYQQVSSTVCQRITDKSQIKLQHVDLGKEERSILSLGDAAMINLLSTGLTPDIEQFRSQFGNLVHAVRERVWVARILSKRGWPVLFVCGANHAVPVHALFLQLGISAKIVHSDYDP